MIRIAVVEDHVLFRKGLVAMLQIHGNMGVVAEYTDGKEFLDDLAHLGPDACDLIFLDLALPYTSGMELLALVQEELAMLPPICILSMYPDVFYLDQAKKLGVKGYLTKDSEPAVLYEAVQELVQGRTFFLSKDCAPEHQPLLENLSEREIQVFKLLTLGLTVKEIAYELQISIKSVSTYKSRLMDKLGVDCLSELFKMTAMLGKVS